MGHKTKTTLFDSGTVEKLKDGTYRKVSGSVSHMDVGIAFYLYGSGTTFRAEVAQGDVSCGTKPIYKTIKPKQKKQSRLLL